MITISLHATPHHGGRGKFRVSGEAYGKDRTGSEHIYDRIRLSVDGSEVDLYLDRLQVMDLHRTESASSWPIAQLTTRARGPTQALALPSELVAPRGGGWRGFLPRPASPHPPQITP